MTKYGARCRNRHSDGVLCTRHRREGALIPDEWTPIDNLPVFYRRGQLTAL